MEKYLKKKEADKKRWIEKVFAHDMSQNWQEEMKVYNEALVKFNEEYPKYESIH